MLVIGEIFAGLAALVHVYIWMLESVLWNRESTRRTFGVRSAEDGDTLRGMAYNQGFYNLFLALGAFAGLGLSWTADFRSAGIAVMLFACLCMVLAAVVLLTSNRLLTRAALVQGGFPTIAVVATVVGLLVS
ncbi:DUF1304 domain-containing protein [Protaetiibacter intestinalis]|uniref:DUF1304 domain-containing protein n=1 Tax=Protaetiibacter intestinalis TaxID=2419774 RepID=A0A387BEZ6_9MICO|nr:DUF1304 domain-containing protein [Protaetiibacter intestinalis]